MYKLLTTIAGVHSTTHITRNEWCKSITHYKSRDNCSSPEPNNINKESNFNENEENNAGSYRHQNIYI